MALTTSLYIFIQKFCKKRDIPNIAIISDGGIGDCLCYLNYAKHLHDFCQGKPKIDFYCRIKNPESLYNPIDDYINKFYSKRIIKYRVLHYDLIIRMSDRYPRIIYINKEKLNLYSCNELLELNTVYEKHFNRFRFFYENSPRCDGYSVNLALLTKSNRVSQPDIEHLLKIKDFKITIPVVNEIETLCKFGLKNQRFVTLNRSTDSNNKEWESTKFWSKNKYIELINQINKENPQFKLIYLSPKRETWLPTVCINLSGLTNFEELKILLKHANVHIGPEGGMVHMRHVLSKRPSIVLFGSTSVEFYGYSENFNLTSDYCYSHCEWLSEDWNKNCPKTGTGPRCEKIERVTTKNVIDALNSALANHD